MPFRKFSPFQLPLLSYVRRNLFVGVAPKRRHREVGIPEALEVRCLLSATMSAILDNGQLTITDTDATGKDNQLSVSVVGTDLVIDDANEQFIAAPAGGSLSNGDMTLTIPLSLVTERLTINGGGGEDAIEVNSLGAAFGTDLFINGDAGADTLTFQSGPIITSRNINVTVDTITVNTPLTVAAQMEWVATGDDTLLSINAPISIGGYSTLAADKMAINAAIDVALGWLKLYPESTADTYDAIDIGAVGDSASNTLQLSQEELDRLTAESIFIGDYFTGPVTISDSIEHDADSHFQIQTFLNVAFNSGTGWTTHNGDLRITAAGTAPGIHNFVGIDLSNATLSSSGTGIIALDGRGGSGGPGGSGNTGIHAHDGTVIESTGTGKIYVLGTGGGGTSDSRGVQIDNAGITSVTGDIQVLGQGGSGDLGHGVWLLAGGAVESAGSAKIAVEGTGGNGSNTVGVLMYSGNGAKVSSVDGEITIIGHGGQSVAGSLNRGIVIASGAVIQSTGIAPITLNGTGGSGADSAEGVEFRDVGTRVTSVVGNIYITGQGGDNTSAHGVWVATGSVIDSSGTASVTIEGTGGNATDSKGVYISGNGLGTRVSSVDGDLTITGQGGSIPGGNTVHGLVIVSGALVQSTGLAKINLQGTSGDALYNTRGIEITSAEITSATGDIHITGQGGPAIEGHGVMISDGGIVASTGTAKITIEGTGGLGNSDTRGVQVGGATTKITSVAGDIHITGHGRNGINHYNIGVWLLSGATVSSSSIAKITIDGTGGSGISENNGVIFNGYGTAGPTNVTSVDGDITITGHGASSGTGSANRGIGMYTGAMIQSTGIAKITLDGTGGAGSDSSRGVELVSADTRITSMSGDIQITGHGGANASAYGIWIVDGAAVESTVSAKIALNGTGGDGTDGNAVALNTGRVTSVDGDITIIGHGGMTANGDGMRGVWLLDGSHVESIGNAKIVINGTAGTGGNALRGTEISDGTVVRSAIGDIEVTGHGGPNAIFAFGIWLRAGAVVESTGTAKVTLNGTGGDGVGGDVGVMLNGYGNGGDTRIKSLDGDIHITGLGGNATNESNWGIGMFEGASVESTGSARINLEGTGGSGSQYNRGVEIADTGTKVTSQHGDISITGVGGTGGYGIGVWLRSGALVESTDTAKISIQGTGGDGGNDVSGVYFNGYGSNSVTRVASVNGDISIVGQGGHATGGTSYGVGIYEGAVIESTGTAKIDVNGTGGSGASSLRGVEMYYDAAIRSQQGDVTVTGHGTTGTGTYNLGVYLTDRSIIESTGTLSTAAKITINGTAGSGTYADIGVFLQGESRVSSHAGDIQITGEGGSGTGDFNYGICLQSGATVESTGTARITMDGNAQTGASYVQGIAIELSGRVLSVDGNIQITGEAGLGTGNANIGIAMQNGGIIEASGAADITLHGTGGQGTDANYGFRIYGSDSWVSSADGDIGIVGVGGTGTTTANAGVALLAGGTVSASGLGYVTVTGTGGTGVYDGLLKVGQVGVWLLDSNSVISAKNGDITVTGIGGDGTIGSDANHGVKLQGGQVQIVNGGLGNVRVTGTAGGGSASVGIHIESDTDEAGVDTSEGTGSIVLIGDSIIIDTVTHPGAINAGNQVTSIHPKTNGVSIDLGGTDAGSKLGLTDAELDRVFASGLNIGDANSGNLTVSADITRPAATNMQLITGGDLLISGGAVDTLGGPLLLDARPSPSAILPTRADVDVNASLTKLAGTLSIGLNGLAVDSGYSQLNILGGIDLNGIHLQLTGSLIPTVGNTFVIVNNDATDAVVGTFHDLPEGTIIIFNGRSLQISYVGRGDGNDVVLTAVNQQPVASDATITVTEDVPFHGNLTTTDVDSPSLTYSVVTGPSHGTVTITDPASGAYTYTPYADYNGSDSFTFRVNDGALDSNVAAVSITVESVNDVPQLNLNGSPVTFSAKANKKGESILVAPNLTVLDPDQSPAFAIGDGTLTVSIDVSAKITKKGPKFNDTIGGLSNASSIGTVTGPNFVNGKLVLNVALNSSTTTAAVQAFLRGITFSTKGAGVKQPQRILRAQLTDADGAASNLLQQTINVTK